MKDYQRVANKIRKMGNFCDIHNCGSPTEHFPVNLSFQLCEPYVIGYVFYVAYDWGKWSIDYTLDTSIKMRADMKHIRGIKTDRDMYTKVEEIINEIRDNCGVEVSSIDLLNEEADCETKQSSYADENGIYELSDNEASLYQILNGEK